MEVLILSKTHMNYGKCCVGGITTKGRYVRLLTELGENQDENTEIEPRQVWEITYKERAHNVPPHIEDVLIQSKVLKSTLSKNIKVLDFILERKIPVWKGSPEILFDNLIKWSNGGSGYIDKSAIPEHSVGFWISDKDLTRKDYNGIRYDYPVVKSWRSVKFKGFQEAIDIIPKGTLLRVSLAR